MAIPERETYYISRVEAILENILGADNVIVPPESLIEELLQFWLYGEPFTETVITDARNVKALIAIVNGETYDAEPTSEIEALLKAIANDEDPDPAFLPPKSRNGKLLLEIYQSGSLDKTKWSDIQKIAQRRRWSRYFEIGEKVNVTYDGTVLPVQLVAVNKDEPDTTAQGDVLTFQFDSSILRRGYNVNIWRDSENRTLCNGEWLSNLADDVKSVIGAVRKTTASMTEGEEIVTVDKLFFLSSVEVYAVASVNGIIEGNAYDYYKTGETPSTSAIEGRIRTSRGEPYQWWLRSLVPNNDQRVRDISAAGTLSSATINLNSAGACPAFCVY